jgi:muconolactone D-isomerase
VDTKVDPEGLTLDELWEVWEEETKAALGAMEVGKIVSLYKVSGQRRVVGILDIESTDELDQIIMAGLPRAEHLTFEQVLPVREYASFAEDIRQRWE